ncbi:MAG: sulfotransferase [Deltaproteobacteria bacterium]|nr:sulfotransferase [Deltaproteobacteria bacterium]
MSARAAAKTAKILARIARDSAMQRLENPVFLISAGQTGTTWLERYLHQHRDLAVYVSEANELWHPNHYPAAKKPGLVGEGADPQTFSRQSYELRPDKSFENVRSVFGAFQALLDKPAFVNKATLICFSLPEIFRAIPTARFVHLVRDGRAVALSKAKKHVAKRREQQNWIGADWLRFARPRVTSADFDPALDATSLGLELDKTSSYWAAAVREVRARSRNLGLADRGAYLELRYEDMCAAPDETLTRLFRFIGVEPGRVVEDPSVERPMSRNAKVLEELDGAQYERLTDRIRSSLEMFGYLP